MIHPGVIGKALRAAEAPHLLNTEEQLLAAEKAWGNSPVLGIDTEFLRERTYRAELGLVQVSDGESAWLIDTVVLSDLSPLKRLFEAQNIMKVFHSASEDLEVLWNTLDVVPTPMIDSQVACALLGQPLQMSYQDAVRWMCGIEVDKEQTRSNWIHRPLRPEQLHYAATDVIFLPAMFERLRGELTQLDRWSWLEEEVTRMIENARQSIEPDRAYLRMIANDQMDIASLRVLKRLAAWREETARRQNLARTFVIPDKALLQIAFLKPANATDFQRIEDLHPRTIAKYRTAILEAVAQPGELDGPIEQTLPLTKSQSKRLNDMRYVVQEEAKALQLDPALLASRKQLEALIRAQDSSREIPSRLLGWREPVITRKLLNLAGSGDTG